MKVSPLQNQKHYIEMSYLQTIVIKMKKLVIGIIGFGVVGQRRKNLLLIEIII